MKKKGKKYGIKKRLAAEIVEVVPDMPGKTQYSYKPGYAVVKDETGKSHIHISGSVNGIPKAKVGMKGVIEYITSPSMSLWYFKAETK